MPNSNNKARESRNINFSASHDQASVLAEMALKHKELGKIIPKLENLGDLPSNFKKLLPEELQQLSEELKKQSNELDETKKDIINLVTYARQIVNDLQEGAKKLSTIHLHASDEKLKHAKSLLTTHKPLTANEKYRFKEIEEALSNTCIIKSAGDETIKFQLGILGYAKDNNIISESEFNYLVVPRLKDNNLLDSFRLRAEGNMILKGTSLEICQALDKALSSDDDYKDYKDSKDLFMARLRGIDYQLSLQRLENNHIKDLDLMRKELFPLSFQIDSSKNHSFEEELTFPEVPDDSLELNSQQPSNEPPININHTEEDQKKSEFVALMEELIPEKKKNVIHIDTVQPISLETIMQASLERSITLSENEIFKHNYKAISKIHEASTLALHKMQEQLKKSHSIDGSSTYEEMARSCDASKKDRDENLKKPEPCKLTGESLVKGYYEFGNKSLNKKIENYKTRIDNLTDSKKGEYGEFSRHNSKYSHLKKDQRKQILNQIYEQKNATLKTGLDKAEKQQALWLGKKTFTQSIEKKGKIKQEEIPFPEKELHFRNLVLDFNSNLASEGKTTNVYQDGVHLVSNKKTEDKQSSIQISSLRASYKSIMGLTSSSSNFYKEHNTKEKNPKQTVGMALGS